MDQAKIKVLFMDDEDFIREVAEQMLIFSGYEVSLACDGQEVLQLYNQSISDDSAHDIVILDIGVPAGWGARQTIKELIKLDPKVCALVSSGYMDDPIVLNYKHYRFSGILPKPYDMDEVDATLQNIIQFMGRRKDR